MADQSERIAVLGGGVSGITTALVLQLSGRPTTLYTHQRPTGRRSQAWTAPQFATLHAAASVLPHSVRATRMPAWMQASRLFFRALAFRGDAGVRTQTHYEMFEQSDVSAPPYEFVVDNFQMLDLGPNPADMLHQSAVPQRTGAKALAGWSFDACFCEAPTYLAYLYRFFEAAGGAAFDVSDASETAGSLVDYLRLGHRVSVNCTGQGTAQLLNPEQLGALEDRPGGRMFGPLLDPWEQRIVRGHYIRANIPEPLVDGRGRFLSYNYTATPEIYPAGRGLAADVYCYPRSDGWVLGGSRQTCVADEIQERWLGEGAGYELEVFARPDGQSVAVPRPIFTVNADLIERLSDGTISLRRLRDEQPSSLIAGIGYRFERTHPEDSVRVECSRVRLDGADSVIVHNYGHGGGGFTLSWGCALDVSRLLDQLAADGWPCARNASIDVTEEFEPAASWLLDVAGRLVEDERLEFH